MSGSSRDYIPTKDADFDPWFYNLKDYVNKKCMPDAPEWTHIPDAARTELNAAYTRWHAAYLITLKPCTKEDRDEKKRIRAQVVKDVIRPFVAAYLRHHPAVTPDDKERMGLHIDKPRRPEIPPPATVPELCPKRTAFWAWSLCFAQTPRIICGVLRYRTTNNLQTVESRRKTPGQFATANCQARPGR